MTKTDVRVRFSIRRTIVLLAAVIILATAGLTVAYDFFLQRKTVVSFTRGALEMLASTGALLIRGEDVLALSQKSDYQKPEYARVYAALSKIYLANKDRRLRENSIYILRPNADGKTVRFAAHLPGRAGLPHNLGRIADMANPRINYIGDSYPLKPLMKSILSGEIDHGSTEVYTDEFGTWVSAYAPILTKDGRRVAILEADFEFSSIRDSIWMQFAAESGVLLLAALFSISVLGLASGRITRPIKEIVVAVDRIAQGDFAARANIRKHDEVGLLADHFNQMAQALEEKRTLSRYVSTDTMRRVEAGAGRGETTRVTATVLFSDVRGFTAYSSRQRAEEVVELLNELLELQADAVVRHGGSVDKFVGDELMAVFTEEGQLERALACAHELQACTRHVLDREGIGLGVGLHSGLVVRGTWGPRSEGTTPSLAAL